MGTPDTGQSDTGKPAPGKTFRCIGGRGQIDNAAASVIAFALRRNGLSAEVSRRSQAGAVEGEPTDFDLICYATHPSSGVRRYTARKLTSAGRTGHVLHLVVDFEAGPASAENAKGAPDVHAGSITTLSRLMAQHASDPARNDQSTPQPLDAASGA